MARESDAGSRPDPAPELPEEPEEQIFHRDRREHGGAPQRLDDDQLAHEAEEERVDAGLEDFDPDDVPPAADTPPLPADVRQSEQYAEERAEIGREFDEDELRIRGQRDPFPPTRYDRE
jgi:hypothetical protein